MARSTAWLPGDALIEFVDRFGLGRRVPWQALVVPALRTTRTGKAMGEEVWHGVGSFREVLGGLQEAARAYRLWRALESTQVAATFVESEDRRIRAAVQLDPMSDLSRRARAAQARAAKRWFVYLVLCWSGPIYTGIARDVVVRYAQHVAGTGARYTRANPPRRLLVKFACLNQSEASRMEVAIKKLAAIDKRKLVGKTGAAARKLLFG